MRYILYNEDFESQGSFANIEELRRFLCDRKYDILRYEEPGGI